ncbi:dsRBD fold-containing protein [Haloglycomyces albus]|uniref:dsRBD fold-containing protein n=1 Tax=Haloglycomyces albus TaxID=526067 RepID=UPI00046CEF9D|nr:dsRBD fold-containing protein [Haloglycomyces albus]
MLTTHWDIQVDLEEDQDYCVATARLTRRDGSTHSCVGRARRNPTDRPMAQIGEELASARALAELSRVLLSDASKDVEFNVRRGDPER